MEPSSRQWTANVMKLIWHCYVLFAAPSFTMRKFHVLAGKDAKEVKDLNCRGVDVAENGSAMIAKILRSQPGIDAKVEPRSG